MRRAAAWAGVVVVVAAAVAAVGFAPWPLTTKRVAENLNGAFDASARVRWRRPDAVTFRALPWPSLRIVDARLDDALGANLILAPEARLDLSSASERDRYADRSAREIHDAVGRNGDDGGLRMQGRQKRAVKVAILDHVGAGFARTKLTVEIEDMRA